MFDKSDIQINLYDSSDTPGFRIKFSLLQSLASDVSNILRSQSWVNNWTLDMNRRLFGEQEDGVICNMYANLNGLIIGKGNLNPIIRPEDISM